MATRLEWECLRCEATRASYACMYVCVSAEAQGCRAEAGVERGGVDAPPVSGHIHVFVDVALKVSQHLNFQGLSGGVGRSLLS